MTRTLKRLTLGALALAMFPAGARAQAAKLPSGREVIDHFIAAMGGKDAILRQTSRHIKGRLEVPAQGISGDLDLYQRAPNKMAMVATIPGLGDVRTGYDGTVAWTVNPAMGPMILDSLQRQQMMQQADFYSELYPERLFKSLETVGEEDFEGTPCYRVKVTTAWGEEYFEFFDRKTGLMVGGVRTQASPMGNMEATSIVSDWKPVDGVLLPHKSVQRVMGMEQVITITSADNAAVPDSVFVVPAEIKALQAGKQ
jgi:hypothetical protein